MWIAVFIVDETLSMGQSFLERAFIGYPLVRVDEFSLAASLVVHILAFIAQGICVFVLSKTVFDSVAEVSGKNSCGLSESALTMELSILIESAFIHKSLIVLVPGHAAVNFLAIRVLTSERVIEPFFLTFSMKGVVSEASLVLKLGWLEATILIFSFIVLKLALIIGAISKDESSISMSFAIWEIPDV